MAMFAPSFESYLIEIYGDDIYRLSTRGTVTYGGNVWAALGCSVKSIHSARGGGIVAELSIADEDSKLTAFALSIDVRETRCILYRYDGVSLTIVMDGFIDGAEVGGDRVFFSLTTGGRSHLSTPRRFYEPPLCNHLLSSSATIYVGSESTDLAQRDANLPWSIKF